MRRGNLTGSTLRVARLPLARSLEEERTVPRPLRWGEET
jgi:hypothetical protein